MNLETLIVPLNLDESAFKKGLDNAQNLAKGFSDAVGTAAKVGFGAAVAGISAISGAAVAGVKAVMDWGDTIDSMGDQLGTTVKEGAGLAVMMKTIGGSTEDLTKQLNFMAKGLVNDKKELGNTGKALKSLKISIKDTNGNLKTSTQLFQEAADKISQMPDGLEKTTLMMELFGKTGAEMSDTLNAAANGGLADFTNEAEALGLALSEDAVDGTIALGKSMETLKLVVQGLFVSLGNELLPILTPIIEAFKDWAISVMPALRDAIAEAVAWLGDKLPKALAFLTNIWETYLKPALKSLWTWLSTNIPNAIKTLKGIWNGTLLPLFKSAWNYLTNTLIPKLQKMKDWYDKHIPGAIDVLKAKYDELSPKQKELITDLGLIVAGLVAINQTPLKIVFPIASVVITPIATAIWGIVTALGALVGNLLFTFIPFQMLAGIVSYVGSGFFTFSGLIHLIGSELAILLGPISGVVTAFGSVVGVAGTVISSVAGIIAIGALLILGLGELKLAYQNNWFGIRDIMNSIWAKIKPILDAFWTWFSVTFPAAAKLLESAWTSVIKPALDALMKVFAGLAEVLNAVVLKAFEALTGFWQKVLLPVLQKVWDWLITNPLFKSLVDTINKDVMPALTVMWDALKSAYNNILPALKKGFEGILSVLDKFSDWLSTIADKIKNLKLPPWLTPGSPTPLELGIRGINDAMSEIDFSKFDFKVTHNTQTSPVKSGATRVNIYGGVTIKDIDSASGFLKELTALSVG